MRYAHVIGIHRADGSLMDECIMSKNLSSAEYTYV